MKLEPAVSRGIDHPNDVQIDQAIRDEVNEEFVILRADAKGNVFIQTSGGIVEYREIDEATGQARHWRSATDHPVEAIIALFCAYNRGDPSYKTAIQWQDVSEELASSTRRQGVIMAIVIVAAIVALAVYFAFFFKK
jgi:preprotein translocase subunit SecF